GDAALVVLGDVLVQAAAVAAFHVGEHADGVLRIGRREDDALARRHRGQQAAADVRHAGLAQVALGADVEQAALQQVVAVIADVQRLPADDDLLEALQRRGRDRVDPDVRIDRLDRLAGAVLGRARRGLLLLDLLDFRRLLRLAAIGRGLRAGGQAG